MASRSKQHTLTSRPFRKVLAALACVVALVIWASSGSVASAGQWRFETLDGLGGANGATLNNVGVDPSVAIWNGMPHVWYHDATGGDLRHAWWNGTFWQFETLDGEGGPNGRTTNDVGTDIAAAVWNGTPHVWYHDATRSDLRHAWWNGRTWLFEVLDGGAGASGYLSSEVGEYIAVEVWDRSPHVWYRDSGLGDLRHAWWNGTTWRFETLDGAGGSNGRTGNDTGLFNDVVVWGGTPHVFYFDNTAGELRHAWWNGRTWLFETLDGQGGSGGRIFADVGPFSSVVVWDNQPHVFYYDDSGGTLRHGWWTGRTWLFETLDGAGGSGRTTTDTGWFNAATVWGGTPHVFYYDFDLKILRHAWWNGRAWSYETLDGLGGSSGRTSRDVGAFATVSIWGGFPHVWYLDETAPSLRHAWYS